eukprot:m.55629 g.55629  ORF g.55629 m.55629 type:complete len:328 (-) comp11978_c3_seq1:48-1031(-)
MAYSREQLDYQYSPSKWALRPDVIASHCSILAEESARSREELDVVTEAYGNEEEVLQIAKPSAPDQKIAFVYFHGGMWQALAMSDSLFMARPLAALGATTVAVEYTLCPKGTMSNIVAQCVRAVRHVHARLPGYRLYLIGHSAGGHLAAMVLAELSSDPIAQHIVGVCPVSGLFDLEPVQRCYANSALNLTQEEIASFSPLRHVARMAAPRVPVRAGFLLLCFTHPLSPTHPLTHSLTLTHFHSLIHSLNTLLEVLLVVAEKDTTLFRDETFALLDALRKVGASVDLVDYPGLDHFSVIENLRDPSYDLVSRLARAVGLLPSARADL